MADNCTCVFRENPDNPSYCYEISWERPFKDTNQSTHWDVNEFPVRIARLTTKDKAKLFCQKHGIPFPENQKVMASGRLQELIVSRRAIV